MVAAYSSRPVVMLKYSPEIAHVASSVYPSIAGGTCIPEQKVMTVSHGEISGVEKRVSKRVNDSCAVAGVLAGPTVTKKKSSLGNAMRLALALRASGTGRAVCHVLPRELAVAAWQSQSHDSHNTIASTRVSQDGTFSSSWRSESLQGPHRSRLQLT